MKLLPKVMISALSSRAIGLCLAFDERLYSIVIFIGEFRIEIAWFRNVIRQRTRRVEAATARRN